MRVSHEIKSGGIKDGADREDARGSVTVGNGAGQRLANTPQEILNRQRKSENIAAPIMDLRHRCEEKAER